MTAVIVITVIVVLVVAALAVVGVHKVRNRHFHTIPDWAAFTSQGAVFVGGICPDNGCAKVVQGEFLGNLWDEENPIDNGDGSKTYPPRSGFAEERGYTVFPLSYLHRCVHAGVNPYDGVDREAYGILPGVSVTAWSPRERE